LIAMITATTIGNRRVGMSSLIGSKGADQGTRRASSAFENANPGWGPPSSA
jgi:hypothetical protein